MRSNPPVFPPTQIDPGAESTPANRSPAAIPKRPSSIDKAPLHPHTYIIRRGDTLSAIATRVYGTDLSGQSLARRTRDLDPKRLPVGHALRLPDRHRPLTNLSRPVKRFRHASAHHEHRAVRVGQDLLRHRAYQQAFEETPAAMTHHDEIHTILLGPVNDLVGRVAGDDLKARD